MKVVKIAFSGKFRSGKTFASRYFQAWMNERESEAQIFSIAAPLKQCCKLGLGTADRETLQLFGTEVIRKGCQKYFGENGLNFWSNYLINTVKSYLAGKTDFCIGTVCDDVRFRNEFDILKNDGWIMIRLQVDPERQVAREDPQRLCRNWDHQSEIDLDEYEKQGKFDYVIDSSKSLDYLYSELDKIFNNLIA